MQQTYPDRGAGVQPEPEAARVERLRTLASWLDDRFRIPGLGYRIGLDGVVGLIPGVGDVATTALSSFIVAEALRLGVPKIVIVRMVTNVGVDLVVGAVPLVGDFLDVGFKANRRNLDLILRHLETRTGPPFRP